MLSVVEVEDILDYLRDLGLAQPALDTDGGWVALDSSWLLSA
jgi:hypothetical protein